MRQLTVRREKTFVVTAGSFYDRLTTYDEYLEETK